MVGKSSSPYTDDFNWSSSSFSEGLAGVKLNGKWGFINQSGTLVIPYQYDRVQQFSGGVATVQANGLWGVINPEGKWIIQPVDKSFIQFFQGIAKLDLISVNESKQLIGDPNIYWDKSGRLVGDFYNPPKLAKEFQEELAIIEIPLRAKQQGQDVSPVVATSEYKFLSWNKCGFQDKQGKVVIKLQFDGCRSFSKGLAAVLVDKKWGYIDKTGKFIVSPQFDYADSLFEERALVVSNGKIGFIDKTGKVAVKPEFDPNLGSLPSPNTTAEVELLRSNFKTHAQQLAPSDVARYRFSNGLAVVGKNDKCGYIDETGKFAIQPQFIGCEPLDRYGVAEVSQSRVGQESRNESLYINREGKIFPQQITPDSLSKFYPARIKLLTSLMACLLWIVGISCHDFGRAIVASWGGGYLSFNARRYNNPLYSIILSALAGPIANILFGLFAISSCISF
ncbi:WG repeat-containing protein [Nostoc sp. CCY0012]|uniref:WG repeat-containing protein n=1 Tax=Nostoc sp. CCY0012 TaxID=1056123 RepID=UPI0039C5C889